MEIDDRIKEMEREYLDFLDDSEDQGIYSNLVKNMIDENKYRLIVNINDLRKKNPKRVASLLENSFEEQIAFENALKQFVMTIDTEYAKGNKEFFIGFEGSFGSKHVTPRTLTSRFLSNLVCLEGIVTKCSLVKSKIVRSVHYCEATKAVMERAYTDLTSMDPFPGSAVYPTEDPEGNKLETEFGLSTFKDHQTLTVQEMPEKAPAGQLPRSIDVICDNDLVDTCKPGDRVQIIGNYRCLPGKQNGYTNGTFRTILIANSINQLSKDATLTISHEDVAICKKLARQNPRNDIFELLSKSLAPSIQGNDYIKKAILCLLLGGVEKVLANGTRLRGDINILLIGDPSVAKSQLLRYVLYTAPRAVATTGRGSSGVGLTAAVTTDQETGERRLEAGAMVLADRGVICIDEFDKMSDIDRTAIHEVMEQGKVTIAKAGIHASLNARCAVLAAANPVYGRYDQYITPMENIGLQDSLLSRFDLLFVMLDVIDPEQDQIISDHVVRMHRYRNPAEQDGEAMPLNSNMNIMSTKNVDAEEEQVENPVYEKYDPLLHGQSRNRDDKILSVKFMRKYIHIAKCMKPKLTEEASVTIADEYARLRSEETVESDVARTQPITARTLETMIRLSTAHAKARLSKTVTVDDAYAAIELIQFAYFKRVLEKEKKKRKRRNSAVESDEEQETNEPKKKKRNTKNTSKPGEPDYDPYEYGSGEEDDAHVDEAVSRVTRSQTTTTTLSQVSATPSSQLETTADHSTPSPTITDSRFDLFRATLNKLFSQKRVPALPLDVIKEFVKENCSPEFTEGEITAALNRMTDRNQVMVADDQVFRI